MSCDWMGGRNGEVVEKRELRVFDSSQIRLLIHTSSEGLLTPSLPTLSRAVETQNLPRSDEMFLQQSKKERLTSKCFALLGFPNIASVVMRSVVFYFQLGMR